MKKIEAKTNKANTKNIHLLDKSGGLGRNGTRTLVNSIKGENLSPGPEDNVTEVCRCIAKHTCP